MRPAGAQADDAWDLVDAARAGDPAAFRLLYADNVAAVRSFLAARTADRALADDLTSETFLRAYTAIHRLSYRGRSFRGWLLTIARNLLLDDVRSARSRHETPLPEDYDATDAGVDPAAEACDRLASADLRRWVDSLPADQRRCVRLRFFEQRTVREVAAALRRSEGSVRALQLRAVRRLAGLLPPDIATA